MSDQLTAVDLFCGAGGLSAGLALAAESIGAAIDLVAVNHWDIAIETHERNHPWADHHHTKVEAVEPRSVVDADEVRIVTGGPQCTHYSIARGGKPVDEQKRASPWHVLDWVSKLRPEHVLLENVPEFESWGPVIDGEPTRNGQFFEAWTETFRGLGYQIDWDTLVAADYGDATTRKRLFVIASRDHRPVWPEATHGDDWRPAAEIIDWSDRGGSIWARDRPLVQNTMQRIAEGVRRFGAAEFEAYATAIESLGADDVEAMQDDVVPASEAADEVEQRDDPFLVAGHERPVATDGGEPEPGSEPFVLGQHGGSRPRQADDRPLPTIATRGAVQLVEPESFVLPRNGAYRGIHSNPAYDPGDRPLHTVTAKNTDGHLVTPYLISYYGNGGAHDIEDPLPTVTTRDRFALVVPELFPWGLDIRYRMLQPRELAAAQGFPDDYDFCGTKTEVTEQIGNAVPVNTATALCERLLKTGSPTLDDYSGGEQA